MDWNNHLVNQAQERGVWFARSAKPSSQFGELGIPSVLTFLPPSLSQRSRLHSSGNREVAHRAPIKNLQILAVAFEISSRYRIFFGRNQIKVELILTHHWQRRRQVDRFNRF